MSNSKTLLREYIRAYIDKYLNEVGTIGTVGTSGTRSTSQTVSTSGTKPTSATKPAIDNNALSNGNAELESKSDEEQGDLEDRIKSNETAIKQSGEVAGKISTATRSAQAANTNIAGHQQAISTANKTLAQSEGDLDPRDRVQAYNDISNASSNMSIETGKIVDSEQTVLDVLQRQHDELTK